MKKMKQTLLLLLILTGINSYSQQKFFDLTCNCINEIKENSNQSIIAEGIQDCFQKTMQNHNSEIGLILKSFVKENPDKDMSYAERNLSKILTEKMTEQCPEFKRIDQKLSHQQQNSDNVLPVITKEICRKLEGKTNLTNKIVDPILIEVTQKHQVSVYGQYNLNERSEMRRYSLDLNNKLLEECPTYKNFVVNKNLGK